MTASENLRWIVAQEGSRERYAMPLALHQLGQLRALYADIWCRYGRSWLSRGPKGARALTTRFNAGIPADLVTSFSPRAIVWRSYYYSRFARLSMADAGDLACKFGAWFANRVSRHLERFELDPFRDAFFGFNTSSLEALLTLKERGIFTVLDQVDPGRVEVEMILEEIERWPGWENAPTPFGQDYWDRIHEEWECADLVMVNSEWSATALVEQGVSPEKIIVVPLALEPSTRKEREPVKPDCRLTVLWLGSLLLRKGIQYLAEAAKLLRNCAIEILVVGPNSLSETALRSFPENMKLLGRVTRQDVHDVYRRAHVFILPTISDGFAVTQLEAMAHGLPVVTTPNCGRVVTDGMDGLIVPPRNSLALADALARLASAPQAVREMSRNALNTVQSYFLPSNALCLIEKVRQHRHLQTAQTVVR